MKRRRFLKQAGWLVAGGAGAAAGRSVLAQPPAHAGPVEAESEPRPAGVLVTSAESSLAQWLADELAAGYRLRLTGQSTTQTQYEFVPGVPDDGARAAEMVRGMDCIVHVAEPPADATDSEQIDHRTRLTYNLLQAAQQEQVRLVVYLSSIKLLAGYPQALAPAEDWRPLPGGDAELLSHYLGEFTCREFAREGKLRVVVLRLGTVIRAEEVQGRSFDPLWVDRRDVAQAVRGALEAGLAGESPALPAWSVFHILSDSPRARFSVTSAKRLIGYRPRFSW
jgi:nucleoside-diphosphate-sugar epimerase